MSETDFHTWATWAEVVFAAIALVALAFVTAPYGRHDRPGWGPAISNRVGWVVMESPAVVLFLALFVQGRHASETVPVVLAALWLFHYGYRTAVFPFMIRTAGKRIVLAIVGMGFVFNVLNAYVISRWISHLGSYDSDWPTEGRFLVGVVLFIVGFVIHFTSDRALIRLRGPGETGYRVPRGRLFDQVTCPNYLGEMIEWAGFAVATWSFPGLAFAIFTVANVGPRAFANRRWYRRTFPDFPADRKALVPYLL